MRMPFGKHRGWALPALPDDYLRWLLTLELREPLATAVQREAARRGATSGRQACSEPDYHVARELVSAGRQVLARRHHPDAGGSHARMVVVNNTADWLLATAREQLA